MGLIMATCTPASWNGLVNANLPPAPSASNPSAALFNNEPARMTYWLPDPPGVEFPTLQDFWEGMSIGITEYRCATKILGPKALVAPPDETTAGTTVRSGPASRESRSPNWSGASVAAVGGDTFTQIVGSWVEPPFEKAGSYGTTDEFRSSIWIGFNGHAAYLDASLPQIGTMQRIAYENNNWVPSRWVWFEWWANTKGKEAEEYVKPVYLDLNLAEGDTVWCRVDLIASGSVDFPYAARMCICVKRAASASKVLIMPFIVYPPKSGNRWSQAVGSTANWIAELPTNIESGAPFLLPRFGPAAGTENRVSFNHCAAAIAPDPGEPLIAERTLEVSKRFHLYSREPRGNPSLTKIATCLVPRTSDTEFSIQVDGNDG